MTLFSPSSSKLVRKSGVLNNPISDHLLVYAILKLRPPKKVSFVVTVRSYKHYNPSSFSSDLASNSNRLLSILLGHDVNLKLKIFNDIFHSVLEVHAPIKIVIIRSRSCPCITREIKDLMRDRDRLHHRFLQTRDNSDRNHYKEYLNKVKITLRNAATTHTFNEVQKHNNLAANDQKRAELFTLVIKA